MYKLEKRYGVIYRSLRQTCPKQQLVQIRQLIDYNRSLLLTGLDTKNKQALLVVHTFKEYDKLYLFFKQITNTIMFNVF